MKNSQLKIWALSAVIAGALAACNNAGNKVDGSADSTVGDTMNKVGADAMSDSAVPMATADTMRQGSADAALVYDLVESMYGGIALMKQGETKASSKAVKDLAKKLDMTHTKLTDELKALAAKKGWKLPAGESSADMSTRESMGTEAVEQYQKDWAAALAQRHETNIGKLKAAKPTDPELKMAGEKGLPVLEGLLADIKKVQAGLK